MGHPLLSALVGILLHHRQLFDATDRTPRDIGPHWSGTYRNRSYPGPMITGSPPLTRASDRLMTSNEPAWLKGSAFTSREQLRRSAQGRIALMQLWFELHENEREEAHHLDKSASSSILRAPARSVSPACRQRDTLDKSLIDVLTLWLAAPLALKQP